MHSYEEKHFYAVCDSTQNCVAFWRSTHQILPLLPMPIYVATYVAQLCHQAAVYPKV